MLIPTPPLPFKIPINCLITLPDATVLEGCLRFNRSKTSFQDLPGISEARQEVNIRLVNPKILPESVKVMSRLTADITDNSSGIVTRHILIVLKIIQSAWQEQANNYGAVLQGVLIQENTPDQANNDNPFGDDL